jgi:hypothetical protein
MKLPLPNRGQPFDLALVYKIIESINNLWNEVGVRVSAYSTIQTAKENFSSVRSSEVRTVAGFAEVINNDNVRTNDDKPFTFIFDRAFKYPPIVSTSLETIGESNTEATKSSTVILTKVSTLEIQGIVKFEKAGTAAVRVNLIAVGIPV